MTNWTAERERRDHAVRARATRCAFGCVVAACLLALTEMRSLGDIPGTQTADISAIAVRHRMTVGGRVMHMGVSETGKRFAAALDDGRILVCEAPSGKVIAEFKSDSESHNLLKFSSDGEVLLCESETNHSFRHYLEVWRVKDGKSLFNNHPKRKPAAIAGADPARASTGDLSPDGRNLILCMGECYIVDLRTGRGSRLNAGGLKTVLSIAYSPDGKRIVCGAVRLETGEVTVHFFRASDLHHDASFVPEGRGIGFTPEGRLLLLTEAAEGNGRMAIVAGGTGEVLGTITPPEGLLEGCALLCRGKRLVARFGLMVRLWELKAGQESPAMDIPDVRYSSRFAGDGNWLVMSTGDGGVDLWDFTPRGNGARDH
jgi:WD40 repeat protein